MIAHPRQPQNGDLLHGPKVCFHAYSMGHKIKTKIPKALKKNRLIVVIKVKEIH